MKREFHKILWLSFLMLLFAVSAKATIQRMDNLSSRNGLFGDTLHKVFRDSTGYLWIVGVNGVARYDGYHFVNFSDKDSNEKFINGKLFHAVNQDRNGTVWVGGDTGIHYFNPKTNAFVHIKNKDLTDVRFIGNYNDSCLWVSCRGYKNFKLNTETYVAERITKKYSIIASEFDDRGLEWQLTSGGKILQNYSDVYLQLGQSSSDFCFSPSGNLFVATGNGLVVITKEEFLTKKLSGIRISDTGSNLRLTSAGVFSVCYFANSIWAATRNGLNQVKLDENEFPERVTFHHNQPNDNYSLVSNRINDILLDNEHILWIATHGGLSRIDPEKMWFYSFQKNPALENTIHDNIIFPISGDSKGNIWFGSYTSGISHYNSTSQKFTWLNRNNSELTGNFIGHIYTDHEDETWVSVGTNLFLSKGSTLVPTFIAGNKGKPFSFNNLTAIVQHPDKDYWISADKKIIRLKKIAHNTFKIEEILEIDGFQVIRFFIDSNKRIWAGGDKGVLLIDPMNSKQVYAFHKDNQTSFQSNIVQAISEDSEGNIWLGTTNGLYRALNDSTFRVNPKAIQFKGFFEENGLTHNYITGLLPGENGVMWLSSWKSIVKYNPNNIRLCRFIPYGYSDGLVSEKFNRHGTWLDTLNNTYYFGGIDGVNYFQPKEDYSEKKFPEVIFNHVLVDGDNVEFLQKPLKDKNGTELVARIKRVGRIKQLSVSFGSSSLLRPEQQVFAWRLAGREEKLTFSRKREFLIKDIKPGKYQLKLRASSKQGRLSPAKIIEIEIDSVVGKAIQFASPVMIVLAILVFIRIKKQHKQKGEKYIHSNLTADKSSELVELLFSIMNEQKPFLKADFNATQLAELMGVSSVKLSQLLNDSLQTKFYEFVNKQRVEEFVCRLKDKENENLTLMGLAELCGFSSKSTFYRAFSKEKGMTPAQFAKKMK